MRLRLDDNERGAFHYLIGGLVVVLILKGVAFFADKLGPALSPDQAALRPFQQGYPMLRGELATVATGTGLSERLVLAVVFAVGVTFCLAVILALIDTVRRRPRGRAGVLLTRAILLITLSWSVYAAFLLPIREASVENGALVLRVRKVLVGDIPWPGSLMENSLPGHDILRLETGSDHPTASHRGSTWIDAVTVTERQRIALVLGTDADHELEALRDASTAAAYLERELR